MSLIFKITNDPHYTSTSIGKAHDLPQVHFEIRKELLGNQERTSGEAYRMANFVECRHAYSNPDFDPERRYEWGRYDGD